MARAYAARRATAGRFDGYRGGFSYGYAPLARRG